VASRKEEKERRRQERLAREQAARQRARARRLYSYIAGGVLGVAAIAAVVIVIVAGGGSSSSGSSGSYSIKAKNTLQPPPQKTSDLFVAAKLAGCELKNPAIQGRTHIPSSTPTPKYSTNPPTSGNHDPVPTPDGVYSQEPGSRHFVHTLEHGRVELQYSPSISGKRKRQLGGLFNQDPHLMLMFPNSTMPYKVAIASWAHLAGCKRVTDASFDVIRDFISRYRDTAPEPSGSQPANF
jgi:hypothetical protein